MRLEEIDKNGTLQGFVLVKNCDRKSAKNGSTYLDLIITDGNSDVVAKIWDFKGTVDEQPSVGSLILVRGTLSLYNNQPQFKIDRYRASNENDNVNISDFVPSANLGFSKAPTGPFIKIVFEDFNTSANATLESGPASTPSNPSGISSILTNLLVPLPEKSSAAKTSVAITNLTPFSAAFFSIAFATSN